MKKGVCHSGGKGETAGGRGLKGGKRRRFHCLFTLVRSSPRGGKKRTVREEKGRGRARAYGSFLSGAVHHYL